MSIVNPEQIQEITAIAAVIIASVALFQTWRQAEMQRKHDELSVRPFLTVYVETKIEGPRIFFHATLDNVGLGPAILKKFEISYEGVTTTLSEIGSIITQDFVSSNTQGYMTNCKHEAIAANGNRVLADYSGEPGRAMNLEELENRFLDVEINISYVSMYNTETYDLVYTGQDLLDMRRP